MSVVLPLTPVGRTHTSWSEWKWKVRPEIWKKTVKLGAIHKGRFFHFFPFSKSPLYTKLPLMNCSTSNTNDWFYIKPTDGTTILERSGKFQTDFWVKLRERWKNILSSVGFIHTTPRSRVQHLPFRHCLTVSKKWAL